MILYASEDAEIFLDIWFDARSFPPTIHWEDVEDYCEEHLSTWFEQDAKETLKKWVSNQRWEERTRRRPIVHRGIRTTSRTPTSITGDDIAEPA